MIKTIDLKNQLTYFETSPTYFPTVTSKLKPTDCGNNRLQRFNKSNHAKLKTKFYYVTDYLQYSPPYAKPYKNMIYEIK